MYKIALRYFSDFGILYLVYKNQNKDEMLNIIIYCRFIYNIEYQIGI